MPKKNPAKKGKAPEKKGIKPAERIKIQLTILKKAPKDKEFVLLDGRKLKDIKELAFALGEMGDDIFWHHVNDARNDFANWVEDTLKDSELAGELKKIRDKWNSQMAVLKHIVSKII